MGNVTDGFERRGWTFDKVDIMIYLENASGCVMNITGGPVGDFDPTSVVPQALPYFEYCYLVSGSLDASKTNQKRKVTGRKHLRLTPGDWEYILSCSELYFNRLAQADFPTVFRRDQRLRIVIRMQDPGYHEHNAYHELKHCYANSWKISGNEADVVVTSMSFDAEDHKTW